MPVRNDVSLSGLRANQQRIADSAHNTANRATDVFERQRIAARDRAACGVQTRVGTDELSQEARRISETVEDAQNNVNHLVTETVERIQAREGFKSNISAFRTQDCKLKSLLDTLA